MPNPYQVPFRIKEKISNNAFHFEERPAPVLYVPELREGQVSEVKLGNEIVFEDFDDDGKLRSCYGLEYFIKTSIPDSKTLTKTPTPVYIFDNHNHAFYFWSYEFHQEKLQPGALLIHIDQHKDNRIPASFLSEEDFQDLEKVFNYTNSILNVGNFIPAAQDRGIVGEIIFLNSQYSLEEFPLNRLPLKNIILDIDLDFFAPEFDYIGNKFKLETIAQLIPKADVITIATSPYFIDQELALKYLKQML